MDHFGGITPNERYNNDLLNEQRKTNQLLEQLISLIKPQKVEPTKVITPKRTLTTKTNTRKKVK